MHFKGSNIPPLFNQAEITLTGKPTIIANPVGNGIHFTNADHIGYKFNVSKPWPYPFDINQCVTGVTLSIWRKWDYIVSSYYRIYISLGKTFSVYRAWVDTSDLIGLRWNADGEYSWYHGSMGKPGKWNLITWKVNHSHSMGYLNGFKRSERQKEMRKFPSKINNELHFNKKLNAGKFSIGPMQLWAGGKFPVFIWRLFQEALKDYDENWESLVMWLLFLKLNISDANDWLIEKYFM